MDTVSTVLPIINTVLLLLAVAYGAGKLSNSVKVLQAGTTELRDRLNKIDTGIRDDLADLHESLSETKSDVAFLKGQWDGSGGGKK